MIMKKKILSMVAAVMLIAGTSVQANGCINVTLSCGPTFDICNFSGPTTQLMNAVLHMYNVVCGTAFEMVSESHN